MRVETAVFLLIVANVLPFVLCDLKNWVGDNGNLSVGNWSCASCWRPQGTPGPNDSVIINEGVFELPSLFRLSSLLVQVTKNNSTGVVPNCRLRCDNCSLSLEMELTITGPAVFEIHDGNITSPIFIINGGGLLIFGTTFIQSNLILTSRRGVPRMVLGVADTCQAAQLNVLGNFTLSVQAVVQLYCSNTSAS